MHLRRILLAFSLASSAASVAFADLVDLNQESGSVDRLEQLTRTLAQGAYTQSDDVYIPAETKLSVQLREKPVELNNATIEKNTALLSLHLNLLQVFIFSIFLVSCTSSAKPETCQL